MKNNRAKIEEEWGEKLVFFEKPSFDSAIIGVADGGHVVYDYEKMILSAMEEEGWSEEDAIEWIEYNTLKSISYVGPNYPIVLVYKVE